MIQNKLGCSVVSIRTDHGREFDNEIRTRFRPNSKPPSTSTTPPLHPDLQHILHVIISTPPYQPCHHHPRCHLPPRATIITDPTSPYHHNLHHGLLNTILTVAPPSLPQIHRHPTTTTRPPPPAVTNSKGTFVLTETPQRVRLGERKNHRVRWVFIRQGCIWQQEPPQGWVRLCGFSAGTTKWCVGFLAKIRLRLVDVENS
nr:retrotransposon protein [Tanacetum cinerariifolium]